MTPIQTSHSHARLLVCLTLVAAIIVGAIAPGARAAIVVPTNPTTAFIQTTGPNALLGIGDYRTNIAGDNLPHEIAVNIACTPGQTYAFQVFDPAIDMALNPPGLGTDGLTLRVLDEQRGAADNTTLQLISPNGTQVANTIYAPNTADATWTTLASVTLPATPTLGVDCGSYLLRSSTAGDDDNAWRFRLWGGNPALPETFLPDFGPDGVHGTGDESWLGIIAVSYQHLPAGCQDFYWFVPDAATNLFMLNFDLDVSLPATPTPSVTYLTPGGTTITGTPSDQTVWNDTPPQQQARPAYANMSTFNVAIGDLTGDATANPEPGLWQATICMPSQNQYSFEVPGYQVYLDPPLLPTVTIIKDDGVTTVTSPGTTTYTLTLTNPSPDAAAMPIPGPEVVDTLPAGMSFVSCAVNAPLVGTCAESAPGSRIINFELRGQSATTPAYLPDLDAAPNNVGTLTVVANVAPGLSAGTLLTNTATVDFTDIYGNDHLPVSASDTDAVLGADLSIVKGDQPDPVVPGQTLTYTLLVANAGPSAADNVTVVDTLPAGLTFVSATPPQASGPNPLTWNLGTFAVGSSRTITVVSTVAPTQTGVITNTATVTSTTPDPNPTNNKDDEPTTIVTPVVADVSVVKTDQPDPVVAGQTLTYTLLVANAGPSPADNVTVVDTLPAGLTFVSATPPQASGPNPLTWNLGTLAVGGSRTLTVVSTVAPTQTGVITNTATVTSTTPDPNPTNNRDDEPTTIFPLPAADVSVVKTDQPDPVVAGRTLTYTLLIANAGPSPADNVTVVDTLPAGLTFVSATPPQASGPNPLTWNLGTLAVGSSRAITVVSTVAPTQTGVITNTATVTSTTPDPNPTNNRDDEPTTIFPPVSADVSVVKTDQPDPVVARQTLTYTLLVANAGPSDAQNVVVNDTLPAEVTFVSATPPQASGPNPLTWNLGTLAVGGSRTLTIVTSVVSGTTGVITNTATVTTTTPDPNPNNNTDDEPTTVRPPDAVELLYFRVDGVSGQTVRLAWATAEEIDNFGFNLYRAPANDFLRAALIHFEPSAIKGGGAGATYGYSDTPPQEGVWWYWLADLDTQGRETVHAPVSAAVGPNALPHRAYLPLVQK